MFRFGISSIKIIIAIISMIAVQQASALQCWHCDPQHPFCGVTFHLDQIREQDKPLYYQECIKEERRREPGVCAKVIARDGDRVETVQRTCYPNEKVAEATCKLTEARAQAYDKPNYEVECFTCDSEDGCNFSVQNGPMALLVALPVAIAKIFLF